MWRVNSIKRQNRLLEAQVAERTKELQAEKDNAVILREKAKAAQKASEVAQQAALEAKEAAEAAQRASEAANQAKSVFLANMSHEIVDDRWTNRQLLIKLLNPLGFDLREAANGQEAIEIWETWKPQLICMDIRMPVPGGYEATKRIKAEIRNSQSGIQTTIIGVILFAGESGKIKRSFVFTLVSDT